MSGSGARRHCSACDHEVLDLSAMHAEAAIEALIARAGRACIRYRSDAAGEVQFAPPTPRRAGPIATAALALSACAGWAEDPAPIPPGELGMCIPDNDDANACDRDDPDRAGVTLGMVMIVEHDPAKSLFDRESTARPGRDWWTTARLLRMKHQQRREERQRRREARQR